MTDCRRCGDPSHCACLHGACCTCGSKGHGSCGRHPNVGPAVEHDRYHWCPECAAQLGTPLPPRRCASEACDEYDGIHCYGDGCAMTRKQDHPEGGNGASWTP